MSTSNWTPYDGNITEIGSDYVAALDRMLGLERESAVNCNKLTLKNINVAYDDETSPWSDVQYTVSENTFGAVDLVLENSSLTSETVEMKVNSISATNSPINGIFDVEKDLTFAGSNLEGKYTVDGTMTVESATLEGEFKVAEELSAKNSTMTGKFEIAGDVELNAVVVTEGSEIATVADMTINPVSTFTCTSLSANNVNIEGSAKAVTFKGTKLNAGGNVTINKATLALKREKHTVNGVTTYVPSNIVAVGNIENENGGKVTKETDCTTTENYVAPNTELEEDQAEMQRIVDVYVKIGYDTEAKIATRLNDTVANDSAVDSTKDSGKLINLIKKYFEKNSMTITVGSITENDIKMFEIFIGEEMEF